MVHASCPACHGRPDDPFDAETQSGGRSIDFAFPRRSAWLRRLMRRRRSAMTPPVSLWQIILCATLRLSGVSSFHVAFHRVEHGAGQLL